MIERAEQLAALPSVVEQDLELRGTALGPELVLDKLESVTGILRVSDTEGLVRLSLPSLVRVGRGLAIADNHDLAELELPVLASLGQFTVVGNRMLPSIAAPQLRRANGLTIATNVALSAVSLPLLDLEPEAEFPSSPEVDLRDNLMLESFDLPAAQRIAILRVSGNTLLRTLRFPSLRELRDISLSQDLLTELSLPALEQLGPPHYSSFAGFTVSALQELQLPSLQRVEGRLFLSGPGPRVLSVPALRYLDELWLAPGLMDFEAPVLEEVGKELRGLLPRTLSLPQLRVGCSKLLTLPDCAVSQVVPNCPAEEVSVLAGCVCDPGGNLTLAECPEP